ncbi:hypothetical protein J7J81_01295 [bacterium]|nr:hypothetical protein [bacterium]
MERIIEDLQEDLRNIIEGKPPKVLRKESGDLIDLRLLRIVDFSLQWASVGYKSALRFAGMKFGRRMGEDSVTRELSSLLGEIKVLIEKLKDGKVEIEVLPEKEKAQFRVHSSSLVSSVPNISQTICFFKEGFIEGYLDGVIKKQGSLTANFKKISEVVVEETKCQGKGDKYCQFTIYLKGQSK